MRKEKRKGAFSRKLMLLKKTPLPLCAALYTHKKMLSTQYFKIFFVMVRAVYLLIFANQKI